jgi:hypothetical protein
MASFYTPLIIDGCCSGLHSLIYGLLGRPACALRPLCAALTRVVSMWIVLEKASGAARALAFNLFGLSSLFWAICASFWLAMAYTMRPNAQTKEKGYSDEEGVELMAPLV